MRMEFSNADDFVQVNIENFQSTLGVVKLSKKKRIITFGELGKSIY
ncbi:MAG: hypothetical protein SVZ03_16860 [Spirochaetota bacterium]|nr:hypothetical protein [Spirochaetota bacterium]